MSLVREEAAEWLAAKNYCVAVTSSNLRVVGDWVVIDEFSLGRFYHNAPSLIRHSSGSGVALLIVVDGGVHVTRGAESWDLDKGDALAMPRDCRVELRSVGPYGVVEVELGERFTGRYAVENGTVPTRISAETGTLRLLVSASSLTLTIASSIDCSEWQHLRDVNRGGGRRGAALRRLRQRGRRALRRTPAQGSGDDRPPRCGGGLQRDGPRHRARRLARATASRVRRDRQHSSHRDPARTSGRGSSDAGSSALAVRRRAGEGRSTVGLPLAAGAAHRLSRDRPEPERLTPSAPPSATAA
ncbi:hypothetical protein [Rathayibacter tritici]|nr:hypothetical protein [Rathayibacter tritici]